LDNPTPPGIKKVLIRSEKGGNPWDQKAGSGTARKDPPGLKGDTLEKN